MAANLSSNASSGLEQLSQDTQGQTIILRFRAKPGLYQFTAVADAAAFDWESLYINLSDHGNKGQRTGPWDFDLTDGNRPLVPAFWAKLDDVKLGLWFFQRISLSDLEAKRFRGHMAFYIENAGEHELRFTSYHENPLPWVLTRLEPDPEDALLSELASSCLTTPPAQSWSEDSFWEKKRALIDDKARDYYQEHVEPIFQAVIAQESPSPGMLPVLLTAWRLNNDKAALKALQNLVEQTIALPHWGNPREDGYSHDGDMHAATCLRNLAWVWHATRQTTAFPSALRESILQKLVLQGERFINQALLNRDYWGGSILQDHGWRSFFQFGDAALHLLDVIPQAHFWARYALPRIERGLQAMPRDGVIPPSSYCIANLYLDEMSAYRDARLAFDGDDIYDRIPVDGIPHYLHAILRPQDGIWLTSCLNVGGDKFDFFGGGLFFAQLAERGNELAAKIGQLSLQKKKLDPTNQAYENGHRLNAVQALLGSSNDNPIWQAQTSLTAPPPFSYFADAGLVHYRDVKNDVTFAVRCGPTNGHHAETTMTGPCDLMAFTPDSGHFILARGNRPLLTTPDFGYCLHTAFRSCLLIDEKGQNGDVGYPMSIPSQPYRGGRIDTIRWDEAQAQLQVRLNLAVAYPPELGVAFYVREFTINTRGLWVQDEVLLDTPRSLAWLFQSKREHGIEIDSAHLTAHIGGSEGIGVHVESAQTDLRLLLQETEIVWSYVSSSGRQPFDHLRYETDAPVRHARITFGFNWPN